MFPSTSYGPQCQETGHSPELCNGCGEDMHRSCDCDCDDCGESRSQCECEFADAD